VGEVGRAVGTAALCHVPDVGVEQPVVGGVVGHDSTRYLSPVRCSYEQP
jgi:hypothetical protein